MRTQSPVLHNVLSKLKIDFNIVPCRCIADINGGSSPWSCIVNLRSLLFLEQHLTTCKAKLFQGMHLANMIGRLRDTLINFDHEHENLNLVKSFFQKKGRCFVFQEKMPVHSKLIHASSWALVYWELIFSTIFLNFHHIRVCVHHPLLFFLS